MDFEVCFQTNFLHYIPGLEYIYIHIIIELLSMRIAAEQSYKGVQHLLERNTELFSQRLAGVQSWCAQEKGSLGRRKAQVQN
jgi:hypothetical protein